MPAGRLLEWTAGDGWDPVCKALGVAVPDEPFPHVNTTEDFRAMFAQHAEGLGFSGVLAGPLVRSSYRAGRLYEQAARARTSDSAGASAP